MLLQQKVSGKFELKMFITGDGLMESIKRGLVNFGKGFGIWIILLLFNTRSGESDVNGIKIILDVILAVILTGNYRKGKYMAMLVAILTTVITFLPLQAGWEIWFVNCYAESTVVFDWTVSRISCLPNY